MIERHKTQILEKEAASEIMSHQFPHAVWGAIIAGVVMVIVSQLFLGLLGAGIGLTSINPGQDQNFKAIGIGAMTWWVISGFAAFYFGGWVGGRMAGIPRRIDGVLHGILVWGVTILTMFLMLTGTVGAIIGGGFNLLKSGGQAISQVAPKVSENLPQISGTLGTLLPPGAQQNAQQRFQQSAQNVPGLEILQGIRQEVRDLLQQRGAANPEDAEMQIMSAIALLVTMPPGDQERQKQEIVDRVGQTTNLNPEETTPLVDRWAQGVQSIKQNVQAGAANVGERAQVAAEKASDVAGKGVLVSFVMLAFCAIAAGLGGATGAPHWSEEEIV